MSQRLVSARRKLTTIKRFRIAAGSTSPKVACECERFRPNQLPKRRVLRRYASHHSALHDPDWQPQFPGMEAKGIVLSSGGRVNTVIREKNSIAAWQRKNRPRDTVQTRSRRCGCTSNHWYARPDAAGLRPTFLDIFAVRFHLSSDHAVIEAPSRHQFIVPAAFHYSTLVHQENQIRAADC